MQSEREGAGQRRDGGRAAAASAPARKKHGVSSGGGAGSREEEEVEGEQSRTPARVLGRSRLHQAEASAALGLGRSCRAGRRRRMRGPFGLAVGEGKIWVGELFTVPDSKYRMGFMFRSGPLETV